MVLELCGILAAVVVTHACAGGKIARNLMSAGARTYNWESLNQMSRLC